jgi:hypothetical protein
MSDIAVAESGARLQNFLDRAGLRGFPWKTATILYTISWGWLFIVRDSYWSDDWVFWINFDSSIQGWAPWISYEVALVRLLGLSLMRVSIFGIFLLASMFFFGILCRIPQLNHSQRRMAVLLFLLLPFNTARVTLMVYWYSLGYLIFFLAWYMVVTFKTKRILLLSLGLFFVSFQFHSLLVFYLLPVMHMILLSDVRNFRGLIFWLRKNIVVFFPLTYWVLRSRFWPEEVYYHDVSVSRAASSVPFVLVAGVVLIGLLLLHSKAHFKSKNIIKIFIFGFTAIFAGLFPYVVLGFFKSDRSIFYDYLVTLLGRSDWYSRHLTLQPVGVSLAGVGVISLLALQNKSLIIKFQFLVLAICVAFNLGFGFEYVVDYSKQKEVIHKLKESGESESDYSYTFIDLSTNLNARGRAYRDRDWRGLISSALDSELQYREKIFVKNSCLVKSNTRLVLIQGPRTHWEALKNWVSDRDMGFKVTVDDTPGACKPEMVTNQRSSGAIPILFYFTGAKG